MPELGHSGQNYKLREKHEQFPGGGDVSSHLICWKKVPEGSKQT